MHQTFVQPFGSSCVYKRKKYQMKTYLLLFVLASFGANLSQAQELISFTDFSEIQVKGNLEVTLVPGTATGVIVERGESDKVRIEVQGDRLTIRHTELFRYKSYREFPVKVEVVYSELKEIVANAGARVGADQSLTGTRIDLRLRSGARASLDFQTEKSDIDVAEGAVAAMTGRVQRLTGSASTGGSLQAGDLISERCKMRANTGGSARVQAQESLDAAAHTGGSIYYSGSPEEVVIKDDLGGSVSRRG